MIKRLGYAALILAASFGTSAFASDYTFQCRNFWNQSVIITVETETESEARKMLKTDKAILDKYSLDRQSRCSFVSKVDNPKKKQKKAEPEEETVTPTE